MWLYNTNSRSGEKLTVSFRDTQTKGTPDKPVKVSQFDISLDFEVQIPSVYVKTINTKLY